MRSCQFRVYRWSSDLSPKKEAKSAPVWISFPCLPPHCFSPSALKAISSRFGCFFRMDYQTATLTRPTCARVCVKVDLRKALPDNIWIGLGGGFSQKVRCDSWSGYCNHYK